MCDNQTEWMRSINSMICVPDTLPWKMKWRDFLSTEGTLTYHIHLHSISIGFFHFVSSLVWWTYNYAFRHYIESVLLAHVYVYASTTRIHFTIDAVVGLFPNGEICLLNAKAVVVGILRHGRRWTQKCWRSGNELKEKWNEKRREENDFSRSRYRVHRTGSENENGNDRRAMISKSIHSMIICFNCVNEMEWMNCKWSILHYAFLLRLFDDRRSSENSWKCRNSNLCIRMYQ